MLADLQIPHKSKMHLKNEINDLLNNRASDRVDNLNNLIKVQADERYYAH